MSTHLIVGAGAVGTATALQLGRAGHRVRLVSRSGNGPQHPSIERVSIDATDAGALSAAAAGAVAIYNCASPPYAKWPAMWPPIARALLAAAERRGAVLATTSNLYAYGAVDGPMTEQHPLAATGHKGRVRAQMWLDARAPPSRPRLRDRGAGLRLLRPRRGQRLPGERAWKRLLAGRSVQLLGDANAQHSMTFVPDVASLHRAHVRPGADAAGRRCPPHRGGGAGRPRRADRGLLAGPLTVRPHRRSSPHPVS